MAFITKIRETVQMNASPFIAKLRKRSAMLRTKCDEYARIIREKITQIKELAFSEEYNNYFAAVSFFPFIGWLIPLYLKPENEFCQRQAKRAFYLTCLVLFLIALLLFAGIFFSRDWRLVRFIHAIVIYMVELAYFGCCAYGARMSLLNKEAEMIDKFPFVAQLATIIEL